MKIRFVSVAVLAITATGVQAQSSTVTTGAQGVNAPAPALSVSPSVFTGAHGKQDRSNKNGEYIYGAFIRPGVALGYDVPGLNVALSYEFEATGNRAAGAIEAKGISDNSQIQHHPVAKLTAGSGNWKFNALVDGLFTLRTSASQKNDNNSDIAFLAGMEYSLSKTTSVYTNYNLGRLTNFDSATADSGLVSAVKDRTSKASTSAEKAAAAAEAQKLGGAKAALAGSVGSEPVSTLHAGIVGMKHAFSDKLKLDTYVRAGRISANYEDGDSYAYRFHAHLDFPTPIAELSGFIRYRMNVKDKIGGEVVYQNYALLNAGYELNKSWSVNLENEFAATKDTTGVGGKALNIANENYLGVTYKF